MQEIEISEDSVEKIESPIHLEPAEPMHRELAEMGEPVEAGERSNVFDSLVQANLEVENGQHGIWATLEEAVNAASELGFVPDLKAYKGRVVHVRDKPVVQVFVTNTMLALAINRIRQTRRRNNRHGYIWVKLPTDPTFQTVHRLLKKKKKSDFNIEFEFFVSLYDPEKLKKELSSKRTLIYVGKNTLNNLKRLAEYTGQSLSDVASYLLQRYITKNVSALQKVRTESESTKN